MQPKKNTDEFFERIPVFDMRADYNHKVENTGRPRTVISNYRRARFARSTEKRKVTLTLVS